MADLKAEHHTAKLLQPSWTSVKQKKPTPKQTNKNHKKTTPQNPTKKPKPQPKQKNPPLQMKKLLKPSSVLQIIFMVSSNIQIYQRL